MNARRYLPALLLVPLLLANVAASPALTVLNRLYADPAGYTTGSCTNWATACDLQYALTVAAGDFADDEIWVKQGTYKPTTGSDRTKSFALQNGVSLYGGFGGTETLLTQRNWVTHVTILSGDIGTVGAATDNSYHVVTGGGTNATAVLDGFTITAGNANGAGYATARGGGLYNVSGGPALAHLIFTGNYADYGGGIADEGGSNPTLTHVTFSGNMGGWQGGGMYNDHSNPTLTYVTFSGGAITNATDGGGMYDNSSSPTLTSVTFSGNYAVLSGGGMANNTSSNPVLSDVTFSGNKAAEGGGMFNSSSSPQLTNATFVGNSATHGGGMEIGNTGSPTLTNATFSGNTATDGAGMASYSGSTPHVYDSIFWNDGSPEIYASSSTPSLADSIVQGGCPGGASCTHVISSNPKLGPLQNNGGPTRTKALGAGSAAIDKGNGGTCASTDQRGVTRPQGGKCDMGAYEVRAKAFPSAGANDGWILESGENTSVGGSMDASAATLRVGDDASNKQYRSVLSFDTSALPDAATVVRARVRVKKAAIVGTNPFTTHGQLTLDLKKPFFGAVLGLELGDFQASSTTTPAGSIGSTLVSGWYAGLLNSAGLSSVNKTGTTQLRLRFTMDDNNDHAADYVSLYSGNSTSSNRPLMVVYYNP